MEVVIKGCPGREVEDRFWDTMGDPVLGYRVDHGS